MSLNDFRGVMIQNAFYSVLDGLVANRIYDFLAPQLHHGQAGFIKGLSAVDQFHNLRSIILECKYYYKKQIYLMFLDFKKMFDTVWHNGLFYKMWQFGIRGKIWRIIKLIYNNSHCKLAVDGVLSKIIRLERAVKQGGKTSTTLMILYIDDLIRELQQLKIGVNLAHLLIACLFFADDCTLLAESINNMQLLLNCACKWAFQWGLEFNPSKCKLLRIDPNRKVKDENIDEIVIMRSYSHNYFDKSGFPIAVDANSSVLMKLAGAVDAGAFIVPIDEFGINLESKHFLSDSKLNDNISFCDFELKLNNKANENEINTDACLNPFKSTLNPSNTRDNATQSQPSAEATIHHKAAPFGFTLASKPSVAEAASDIHCAGFSRHMNNDNDNNPIFNPISNLSHAPNTTQSFQTKTNMNERNETNQKQTKIEIQEIVIRVQSEKTKISICNLKKGSGEKILGFYCKDGTCHVKHVKKRCDSGYKVIAYLTYNKTGFF